MIFKGGMFGITRFNPKVEAMLSMGSGGRPGPKKSRKRNPPRERFEVREVLDDGREYGHRGVRVPRSWHLKRECAIRRARQLAATGANVHVVWTHPDDSQYPSGWLDNADMVWSS